MKKLLLSGLLLFVNIVHGQINTPVTICKVKSDTVIVKPEFIEIPFFKTTKMLLHIKLYIVLTFLHTEDYIIIK
jgi:hypothetical protein